MYKHNLHVYKIFLVDFFNILNLGWAGPTGRSELIQFVSYAAATERRQLYSIVQSSQRMTGARNIHKTMIVADKNSTFRLHHRDKLKTAFHEKEWIKRSKEWWWNKQI